ncbi:helix-turn-helix domain-containing protein [Streptomyces sp. NBC_01565]|uniref:tetratricopeptide repeat protein n=1 Tax=unclassified Streptomyces TaxID=2593676 RepID=UPI00224D9272|nr:helix-turn-helix domain-containing protein [Streptomyces sp. NBC_01565]MCX4545824.1 tetratricopeptide repeat protein [Streptomyces sp. NBC_01565]
MSNDARRGSDANGALTELKDRLNRGRAARGLTMDQLVARTGLGRTTLWKAFTESGGLPSPDTIAKLAKVLALDLTELWSLRSHALAHIQASTATAERAERVEVTPADRPDGLDRPDRPERPPATADAAMVRIGRPPTVADAYVERPGLLPAARERVLSGLGGVGKTQLAARHVRDVWQDPGLQLILWVSARDVNQIVTAYAQAAVRLLDADPTEPDQAAQRLMEWLSVTSRRWLVVLDDVQLPAEVQPWWPEPTDAGQVIVTTRYRGPGLHRSGRRVIEVGTYTAQEALEFLRDKLARHRGPCPDPEDPPAALPALAEDLGRLPLALSHAAAHIVQEGITVEAYRRDFARHRTRLEDLFARRPEFPEPYPDPVETTWAISLDVACRLVPGGVVPAVMLLASQLDPAGIPRALLTDPGTAGGYFETLVGRAVTEGEAGKALRVLHRLSLLTDDVDEGERWREVKVHSLVQRATREAMSRELTAAGTWERQLWAAADALVTAGNAWRERAAQESVRHNARALIADGGEALWRPDGHVLLYGVGESLGLFGDVRAAAAYFRALVATAAEHLGPDHADTHLARSRYAHWLAGSGHPGDAAEELRQVIADRTRMQGEDGEDNLDNWANYATHSGEDGDAPAALAGFERLVERRTRIHGPEHPKTLVSRGNLARWRGETGDVRGAIRALTELVPLCERVLGPESAQTLTVRGDLATWQGELNPAVGLARLRRLLPLKVKVFGGANPHTLLTRRNIAMFLGRVGSVRGAITELVVLIHDYERFLDADHPGALSARRGLVEWLVVAGDGPRARSLLRDLLADQARVLGPRHRHTVAARELLDQLDDALAPRPRPHRR